MMTELVRRPVVIGNGVGGVSSDLPCPRCGANYLHHAGVTIFDRTEDAPVCTVTRSFFGKASMGVEVSDGANPSSRRDGLAVTFWCEICGDGIDLTIAQHKGSTEIGWRYTVEGKAVV